ncbi:MAG: LacI family DNA-binding transcriptional regulator [Victivallales bacterium]
MRKNITINDIAEACGISPTVASAALRNKKGSVRYSQELREKVLATAKKMNYRLNRLASAVASGKSPFVAVFLHHGSSEYALPVNFYLHDTLTAAAFALHKSGYEMVFVPYSDEAEQVKRIESMLEGKLVSGVITNFISGHNRELFSLLKKTTAPYAILGNTNGEKLHNCDINWNSVELKLNEYSISRGFKDKVVLGMKEESLQLIVDHHDYMPLDWDSKIFKRTDTLFCPSGSECAKKLIERKKISTGRMLVIDDYRLPIEFRPVMQIRQPQSERAEICANFITEWIGSGNPPENKLDKIFIKEEDTKIVP